MSTHEASSAIPCTLPWCTTVHGSTTHADDEDHRSAGLLVPVTMRSESGVVDTEIEVGLLRRHDEATTWLVLEDGGSVYLALSLESAQRLLLAVRHDEALARPLGLS